MFTQFLSCSSAFGTSVRLGQLTIEGESFSQFFCHFTMEDAVDLPSHLLFSHPEITHGSDELLKSSTTACTHTHTCNPPGPSAAMHTHTCLRTHMQVLASGERIVEDDPRKPRKPLGNREAVRKYREKKKAHTKFLEEEVKKLRAANQQLLRRLQGHAALEAEVVRLRGLLSDVRGKIDASKHCIAGSVTCTDPNLCVNTDGEVAARKECSRPAIVDFEVDESGNISRELDIPEVASSMDAVASLVN